MNRRLAEWRRFTTSVHDERPNRLRLWCSRCSLYRARRTRCSPALEQCVAFCVHCRSCLERLVGYNVAIATFRATLGTFVSETNGAQTFLTWAIAAYLIFLAIRLWRVSPGRWRLRVHDSAGVPDYATKPQRLDFRAFHFSSAASSYRCLHCGVLGDGSGGWHTMDCRRFSRNPADARPLHPYRTENLCARVRSVRYGRGFWGPALISSEQDVLTRHPRPSRPRTPPGPSAGLRALLVVASVSNLVGLGDVFVHSRSDLARAEVPRRDSGWASAFAAPIPTAR